MRPVRDLTGQKIGRLAVLGRAPNNKLGQVCWYCECECGSTKENPIIVPRCNLISGNTRSCGCLYDETRRYINMKHGHAQDGKNSSEYHAWRNMKDRCLNPNNPRYKDYGGSGVTVYPPWIESFEAFLAYMGAKPSLQHSPDRWPNKYGNYEPGNVRWATPKQQAANRRDNHEIPLPDGRVVILSEFARLLGLTVGKLSGAIYSAKRSISNGTTTPAEQGTKLGILIIFWMLLAGILKAPDDHHTPVRAVLHLFKRQRDQRRAPRRKQAART